MLLSIIPPRRLAGAPVAQALPDAALRWVLSILLAAFLSLNAAIDVHAQQAADVAARQGDVRAPQPDVRAQQMDPSAQRPEEADPQQTGDVRAQQRGDILGDMHEYWTWSPDEDLLDIARADELGLIELMVANPGVDPWLPQRGLHLLLPTMHILPDAPRKGIVINTAELRLFYFDAEDGYFSYPLGVGRDGYLTPVGTTKIVRKKDHPSWTLTPSELRDHPELPKVVPPGEDNPLGDYAMYLGWPSYLIHGTNTPWGIGRRTSRGCIRMYPEDIEFLFQHVPVGTQVTVVDEPVKLGWRDDELYIEVQPSTMQVDAIEESSKSPGPPDPIPLPQEADRILAKAGEAATRLDWPVIEKALSDRQGYPIRITLPQATQSAQAGPAPATPPQP